MITDRIEFIHKHMHTYIHIYAYLPFINLIFYSFYKHLLSLYIYIYTYICYFLNILFCSYFVHFDFSHAKCLSFFSEVYKYIIFQDPYTTFAAYYIFSIGWFFLILHYGFAIMWHILIYWKLHLPLLFSSDMYSVHVYAHVCLLHLKIDFIFLFL